MCPKGGGIFSLVAPRLQFPDVRGIQVRALAANAFYFDKKRFVIYHAKFIVGLLFFLQKSKGVVSDYLFLYK